MNIIDKNNESVSLKEFIKLCGVSKSNILRFYGKNIEIKKDTFMIKNKRYYPLEHMKYFNSQIMFNENKRLLIENKNLKQSIDEFKIM